MKSRRCVTGSLPLLLLLFLGSAGSMLAAQGKCVSPPPGLIGWWKAEGNTLDEVGANDGTLLGDASYGSGRVGQAFAFDGQGDGVSIGSAPELQLQDFTIEAWIRRSTTTQVSLDPYQSGVILSYGPGGYGFALWDDGRLFLTRNDVSAVFATLAVTDSAFHHVAVTKSGDTVVFYLDGAGETAAPYNPGFTFTSPAAIGGRGGDLLASFLGWIDEVAVYSRALTPSEVQAIFAAGEAGKCTGLEPCTIPGMVSWWAAEEDALDSVGEHHGELLNGVEFASGLVGSAFRFDGADARVRIPAAPELDLWQAPGMTVEGWVWPEALNPVMVLVEWHDLDTARLGVQLVLNIPWPTEGAAPASVWANLYDGVGISRVISSEPGLLTAQQWSHVALTRDAASNMVRLFLNGTIVAEQTMSFSGTAPVTDVDVWLGGRPPGSAWGSYAYQGLMDEFSLYQRALAPAEVSAIYQAAALGKCAPPSPRRPLARWAFDETEGSVASDSMGTRHGTLSANGAEFVPEGVRGNALRLTRAEGGYVNMGEAVTLGNAFTLVAWVKTKPNDTTETMVVTGQHAAGTVNGYYLSLNRSGFIGEPGKVLFVASDPAGAELVSASVVNDGEWHQVAAVYEGGVQRRLYVDGQPAEVSGPAAPLVPNTAPFLVGGVTVGGMPQGFFDGWIDEAQVYGRALADAEVEYLFRYPDAEEIPDLLAPQVLTGLVGQTVERGATVELAVEATGDEPLIYEWRKDGVVIEEAQGPVLVLSAVRVEDGGVYEVRVSNRWGTASSSATLRVLWPPVITEAPVGQGVNLGGSVTLSVTAEGAAPLQYMWLRNGRPVTGATSRFLLISSATAMSAGDYQVRVANADGVVVSNPVKVWVYSGWMDALPVQGGLQLEVSGLQAGRNYVLEYTGALPAHPTAWEPLVTVIDAAASFRFTDPDPVPGGGRYYRLRLLP
jgi:hypothetical protein